ncbi:unnamed protein product [Urochloa humidicola]
MPPTLRHEGEAPPVYGDDSDEFTIEVHHGGFFVGQGSNRAYIDEKVDWFDKCEVDTWSPLWLHDFVEQLNYPVSDALKIYWLLPGKDLADGFRIISSDRDTMYMTAVVPKFRNFVVYFDHDDNITGLNWDDIVANPIVSLPKVISPSKVEYVEKKMEKLPEFYSNLKHTDEPDIAGPSGGTGNEDSDSDFDLDFVDSDYELWGDDDDLFSDNVDADVIDDGVAKGKGKMASRSRHKGNNLPDQDGDELSSEDELYLPDSDEEGQGRMRFQSFRDEDMENPIFKVGMIFDSVEKLRKAITEYSCKQRVDITMPRNEKKRFRAVCSDGCPWTLYASSDTRTKSLMVKTFNGEHNCQKKWVVKRCTSKWLASKYIETFRADQKMTLTNFARIVQKEFNISPPRTKLARARRLAMKVVLGDEVDQCHLRQQPSKEDQKLLRRRLVLTKLLQARQKRHVHRKLRRRLHSQEGRDDAHQLTTSDCFCIGKL